MKTLFTNPVALLSMAIVGTVVFGVAHLVSDLVGYDGDGLEQVGGVLTDTKTIVTGVALLVGFVVVVNTPAPAPPGNWPGMNVVEAARVDPRGNMHKFVKAFLAVAALQTVVAFIDEIGDDTLGGIRLLSHDVLYLLVILAFVLTLTAVGIARQGGEWPFAPKARDAVSLALLATPVLGGLMTVLWFIDLQDVDIKLALAFSGFALMETVAAFALLVAAAVTIRSHFPAEPDDKIGIPDPVSGMLDDPLPMLDKAVPTTAAIGGLYTLMATAFYSDLGGGDALWEFLDGVKATVALTVIVVVARAAARQTLPSFLQRAGHGADALRLAVPVVAAGGIIAALVAAWLWRDDSWRAAYWFFNRLIGTTILVGVLAGLSALHRPSASHPTTF